MSGGYDFRRACFSNDLCESTNSLDGPQGRGLLKRRIVVEKVGEGGQECRASGAPTAGRGGRVVFGLLPSPSGLG